MKMNLLNTLLIAGSILFIAAAVFAAVPQAGDTAPLFTGQDQDGKTVELNSLIGKKIVLMFISLDVNW
jgi:peroxiredoxin